MKKPKKQFKYYKGQSATNAVLDRLLLPAGYIIHVNGFPFKLENDSYIIGNKRNFVVADLLMDNKQTSV